MLNKIISSPTIPLLLILFMVSCGNRKTGNREYRPVSEKEIDEASVRVNKKLVTEDQNKIRSYVDSAGLDVVPHASGLWYKVIEQGSKDRPNLKTGDVVVYRFNVKDLKDNLIYSSDEEGIKSVMIGHQNIESGLDIGLKMMNPGDSAVFIIPPHLAWGNVGDDKRIPGRTIIIYEVKILDIQRR